MTSAVNKPSDHTTLVQKYFDDNAQSWHDYYQAGKSLTHIILKDRMQYALAFMRQHLPPGNDKKVLDAGCGSGLIGVKMAQLGYQVEGWDISEEMIALSEQNFATAEIPTKQYHLNLGNLLESNLPTNTFDGMMALGFLQYQTDEGQALRHFHRLLRPNGILVISGPVGIKLSNYFGLADNIKQRRQREKVKKQQNLSQEAANRALLHTISTNNYSVKRFQELLETADFQMLGYKGHGYANFEFIAKRLAQKHQKRLHRALSKTSKLLPIQRYANDMVVVAKKK